MNQRSEVMTEFLNLKNELNESNKFANQQTLLVFEIEEEISGRQVLFAKLSVDQRVRLCSKDVSSLWTVESKYEKISQFSLDVLLFYEEHKIEIKLSFNDYFFIEFNKLLGFK